jgi:ribose transport system permease protein
VNADAAPGSENREERMASLQISASASNSATVREEGRGQRGIVEPAAATEPAAPLPRRSSGILQAISRFGVPLVAVVFFVVFSITNPTTFPTVANLQVVAASNSIGLLLALAGLAPLIGGEFDLSIGFILELSAVATAVLVGQAGLSAWMALIIVLVGGALIGSVNALLIMGVGISSFIATLGVGSLAGAASLYLTQGSILIEGIPRSLIDFGQGLVLGVPTVVGLGLGGLLAYWFVFEHTVFGRKLLAVGLSRRSSELAGINPARMILASFVLSGMMSALCGFLVLARTGSASSGIGTNFLLPALAACFLGATAVRVGRFNPLGTGFAVMLVAIGLNGLQLIGVPGWVEPGFDGAVLLIAVGASRLAQRVNRQ